MKNENEQSMEKKPKKSQKDFANLPVVIKLCGIYYVWRVGFDDKAALFHFFFYSLPLFLPSPSLYRSTFYDLKTIKQCKIYEQF